MRRNRRLCEGQKAEQETPNTLTSVVLVARSTARSVRPTRPLNAFEVVGGALMNAARLPRSNS